MRLRGRIRHGKIHNLKAHHCIECQKQQYSKLRDQEKREIVKEIEKEKRERYEDM